jgi:hypothetical protein
MPPPDLSPPLDMGMGDAGGGPRWQQLMIQANFNPSLDPALELAAGANGRTAAFNDAVGAWNTAIKNTCPKNPPQLVPIINQMVWAGPQTVLVCDDQIGGGPPVYAYNFYNNDGANVVSTGRPLMTAGAGWIVGVGVPGSYGAGWSFDDILGLTRSRLMGNQIVESDILWFTHSRPLVMGNACARIAWDYNGLAVPPVPGNNQFDFYSVVLHELGHLLGLSHQMMVGVNNNIMRDALPVDTRYVITNLETGALKALYCP